jgi:hypothetical protein
MTVPESIMGLQGRKYSRVEKTNNVDWNMKIHLFSFSPTQQYFIILTYWRQGSII